MNAANAEVPEAAVAVGVGAGAGIEDEGAGAGGGGVGVDEGAGAGAEVVAVAEGGGIEVSDGDEVVVVGAEAGVEVEADAEVVVVDVAAEELLPEAASGIEDEAVVVVAAAVLPATVLDGVTAVSLPGGGATVPLPTCHTRVRPTFVMVPELEKQGGTKPPQKICVPEALNTAEFWEVKGVPETPIVSGWFAAFEGFCQSPRHVVG